MKIAVLGATGAVGRTMLHVLEERAFPADELVPLASERSAGSRLTWRGRSWEVRTPTPEAFDGCVVALFSAGAERSRRWAEVAAARGAVVVDNSSAWRMSADVPLVVPEINPRRIAERPRGIIANPNCSTIQLVMALEPLRRAAGLRRVVASTYQSVSGAGAKGIATLRAELRGEDPSGVFAAPIAGNLIPSIGPLGDDGWTEEEHKMRAESRKILELPDLAVAATCVRVPVDVGHSVSATVETEEALGLEAAHRALAGMPGVRLHDAPRPPQPSDAAGRDEVIVGRIRIDPDVPRTLHLWIVADNLRKGAATNAVQIAERVVHG